MIRTFRGQLREQVVANRWGLLELTIVARVILPQRSQAAEGDGSDSAHC